MLHVSTIRQLSIETTFQALLEAAPDAIVIVDRIGHIVMANGQTERLFGYTRSELIGKQVDMLLPDHLRAVHTRHRAGYVAAPRTRPMGIGLDLVARHKDGSLFPVEISLSSIPTDDGLLVTSVIRDVSERKRAADELERQVQRRTAHLNALLELSKELLTARGLDGILQRVLSHAMALVPDAQRGAIYLYDEASDRLALRASAGLSPLSSFSVPVDLGVIGLAFASRRAQLTESVAEYVTLVPEIAGVERQDLLRTLDLQDVPSGVVAFPLLAHDQAVGVLRLIRTFGEGPFATEARATLEGLANVAAAAILEEHSARAAATLSSQVEHLEEEQRSLTARLTSAEAAGLQAARLAAVGQLAASIAHEINNPLYAARNSLYLLEEDLPADLRGSTYLGIARDQLARIARIIERMRDFYRPDRGELTSTDINDLLEGTLVLTGINLRHVAIDLIFTPARDLPSVVCNGDQLRQVFLNLILNAIDAMPNGGTLTVRTIAEPLVAIVEVEDSGIGIPADILPRLFEPFFTNKSNGTGLGLSISAHIVTQHGGQIEVESTEGQGSTFRVILPYQPKI